MKERINRMNINSKQAEGTAMETSNKKEWRTPKLEALDVQETAQEGPLPPPEPS